MKIVSYLRVSTARQGQSGLGLEAQRAAVADYAKRTGAEIAREFVEVESGKVASRPQLQQALAFARRSQATLCCAKLDRLSRNVRFLAEILDSSCAFVAVDMPQANTFMLHVMAAIAEHEAKAISERTKSALAALKARGTKLGTPANLTPIHAARGRALGNEANRHNADRWYAGLYAVIQEQRQSGKSLQAIADALNEAGERTRHGKPWNRMQVLLVLRRAASLSAQAS